MSVIVVTTAGNSGKTCIRPLDLGMVQRSDILMNAPDARAFRMLFGFEKNGFSEHDVESVEDKFRRLIPDMGISTHDMDVLYRLLVTGSVEECHVSTLWKFGIFVTRELVRPV